MQKKIFLGAFKLWQMNLRNFLCIFLLQNLHLSYTERQQSFVAHIWKQLEEEEPLKLCFFDANFVVCLLDSFMFLKIENVSNFLIKNALTMNHSQSPVFLRKKPLLSWNDVKKNLKKKKKNKLEGKTSFVFPVVLSPAQKLH